MDIQRGDQVYYRGEVWTVGYVASGPRDTVNLLLQRMTGEHSSESMWVRPDEAQRVEQVR